MPDFDLSVTGATVEPWLDPVDGVQPSRLNPRAGRSLSRVVGSMGIPVYLSATVNGVVEPLDSALGGRLFVCEVHEAPSLSTAHFLIATAGQSSRQYFTPMLAGHYLVGMRRPSGGAWFAHLDILEAT